MRREEEIERLKAARFKNASSLAQTAATMEATAIIDALISHLEAEDVAGQDLWCAAVSGDTLQGLLWLLCTHIGFPQEEPLYGATSRFHVQVTRRKA